MTQLLPTLLILLLTALIGFGLFYLIKVLDRMGGEGHGHGARPPATREKNREKEPPTAP